MSASRQVRRARRGGARRAGPRPGPRWTAPRCRIRTSSRRAGAAGPRRPARRAAAAPARRARTARTSTATAPGSAAYASSSFASSSPDAPALVTRTRPGSPLAAAARRVRRSAASTASRAARPSAQQHRPGLGQRRRRGWCGPAGRRRGAARAGWIARDSGGCAMPRRSAARPKCSSSATATKYRSSRVSTGSAPTTTDDPAGYRRAPRRCWSAASGRGQDRRHERTRRSRW